MSKFDLLENAVSSIQIGIEDYLSDDRRRLISAVRNFYSGVLLLGKQCLLNKVPGVDPMDVLATKFEPELGENGELKFQPSGHRTIDLTELRGRFKKFHLTWPNGDIDSLQRLRNNFEHYHSPESKDQIQQIIAKCFPMVEKFFELLSLHPSHELGDTWKVMLEERNFFEVKKNECDQSFKSLPWAEFDSLSEIECPECGSTLLKQKDIENESPVEAKISCLACTESISSEYFAEMTVKPNFLGRIIAL